MTSHVRRLSAGGFSILAVLLAASAVAWACSPAASLNYCGSSPREGASGTNVTLCGENFQNGRTVEVHWGATSPALATATVSNGGVFTIPVTVPANAAVGANAFVVAFSYDTTAQEVNDTRQLRFDVLPTRAKAGTEVPPPGVTSQTGGTSGGGEPDSAFPATPAAASVASPTGSVATVAEATGTESTPALIPAPRTLPVSANPGAVRQAGRTVFGGSVAPDAPAASAPAAAAAAEDEAPAVAGRTGASGDLWSGFASGTDAPAFGLNDSAPSTGAPAAGLAAALFAAGMMALFAGFGIAEVGRRRAAVRAGER